MITNSAVRSEYRFNILVKDINERMRNNNIVPPKLVFDVQFRFQFYTQTFLGTNGTWIFA